MDHVALAAAFDAALEANGSSLTHDDLLRRYAPEHAPAARRVDLEACTFFDLFMANPQELNRQYDAARAEARRVHGDAHVDAILKTDRHHPLRAHRQGDYRLDLQQQRALEAHGVTLLDGRERTFGAAFNDLYQDDMPVFVSADAVLHAWHMSFDAFYMDMEETSLKPLLEHVLTNIVREAHAFHAAHQGHALLGQIAVDLYDYLAVALGLIQGKDVEGATDRVGALWRAAAQAKETVTVEFFGVRRALDFSLLEPRGHYSKTPTLAMYFRAFTWLAMMELRVADSGDGAEADLVQLRAACCVVHLLREGHVARVLAAYERTLDALVGSGYGPDALTPRTLLEIVPSDLCVEDLSDKAWCVALQDKIRASGAAFQLVNNQIRDEANASDTTPLPLAFCFVGQYAAWDAFAMSRVVFDRVRHTNVKVVCTLPSTVDIAFAVMGNDAATRVLAKRMAAKPSDPDFVDFRDGLPYASNLIALRQALDKETARVDTSKASLTTLWMLALRELSSPSAHSDTSFQSQSWKLRVMNAQIGSYMQLKHDTVLTAKQPFAFLGCSHPAAFVDPYPEFWEKMAQVATRCTMLTREMNQMSLGGGYEYPKMDRTVEFFFANIAEVMRKLKAVAVAQANRQELSKEQDEFLKAVMEGHLSSGPSRFEGWYPGLFYRSASDSVKRDNQVIDVFTNSPSPARSDPGGVLHLQVPHAELCAIVVDNTLYAVPIFNHREFVAPAGTRYAFGLQVPAEFRKRPDWVRDSFAAAVQ